MGKKEKVKKLKNKKEKNKKEKSKKRKLPYIIGLVVVSIILFFCINYYLSQNYVYNIPFTNLNINGNNPIINADSENIGNVYYIKDNKLEEVSSSDKVEALKNAITADCTREYISFSTGYPRVVRNYIIYPYESTKSSSGDTTSNENSSDSSSSVVYSLEGSVNNNSFKGEVTNLNSNTGEYQIEYTISQSQNDSYINVYVDNNNITLVPSDNKDSNASFVVNLSKGTYKIDYNFTSIQNAEKVLNSIYNYVLYGNINN